MRRIDSVAGSSLLLAVCFGVWATGCGGPEEPPIDGSVDAQLPEQDAGSDASADAGLDAAIDAGGDAGGDAGTDAGGDAGEPGCVPEISPALLAHLDEMATSGWRALNADRSMLMHGCTGAATPLDCFASEPLASETAYGATWDVIPGARLRVLHSTSYASSYWTRSSPDGRFVAHGASGSPSGARIVDLSDDRSIVVDALYDPGFFPDGSGFMFQGSGALCAQSVLTAAPTTITFDEPGCRTSSVGLNQHLAVSVDGGGHWALHGHFTSDNGGHVATRSDPDAAFGAGASSRLTQFTFDGSTFLTTGSVEIPTPLGGDTALSPSSGLMASRVSGPDGAQEGLVIRSVETTMSGAALTAETTEVGHVCANGGTPAFSYDERWIAIHHYIGDGDDDDAVERGFTGADDPAYAPYREQGASDVYLVDLRTGARTRVTGAAPGQYALYPHFRSDGWLYFIVRTLGSDVEHVVASDAALVLGAP